MTASDRVHRSTTDPTEDARAMVPVFAELAATLDRDMDVQRYLELCADLACRLLDCDALAVVVGPDAEHLAFSPGDATYVPWVVRESGLGPWHAAVAERRVVHATAGQPDGPEPAMPGFSRRARAIGLRECVAFPLCHDPDGEPSGALVALWFATSPPARIDEVVGASIARVIASRLEQHRTMAEATERAQQLQLALDSRVLLEQAKGMISGLTGVSVGVAFQLLRDRARRTGTPLLELATAVVERRIAWDPPDAAG